MADAMEALVAKITRELLEQTGAPAPAAPVGRFTAADYPLLEKHPEVVRTPTGKPMEAITMEAVRSGAITGEDLRISRDMLLCQADVAESAGKKQMAEKESENVPNFPSEKKFLFPWQISQLLPPKPVQTNTFYIHLKPFKKTFFCLRISFPVCFIIITKMFSKVKQKPLIP